MKDIQKRQALLIETKKNHSIILKNAIKLLYENMGR